MPIILGSKPGGGGGGAPSGPAGGSLGGTYPNPSIANGAVGAAEIAANAVGSSELADNAVDTAAIAADAVTNAKADFTWANYTPTLTASTTDPTLGAGASQLGRWVDLGHLAIVHAAITFGTSGVAAGSGTYRVGMPFTFGANQLLICGSGFVFDSSLTDTFVVLLEATAGQAFVTMFIGQTATAGSVTNAVPFTWAASDVIRISLTGEIA